MRKSRIRKKISGTEGKPRLSVYRSHKHIQVQLIDDEKGVTLESASDLELKPIKKSDDKSQVKVNISLEVGKLIAKKALKKNIKN